MAEHNGLHKGALGVIESVIMGIAGTAPAYSIAATTALIVGTVGVLSVGSILYCGLIMFGMMLAFINLNRMAPDAGASFAWVSRVFGPTWGFFTGWGLIVASVVFMVTATVPAARVRPAGPSIRCVRKSPGASSPITRDRFRRVLRRAG